MSARRCCIQVTRGTSVSIGDSPVVMFRQVYDDERSFALGWKLEMMLHCLQYRIHAYSKLTLAVCVCAYYMAAIHHATIPNIT